jgi:hypothetical protein
MEGYNTMRLITRTVQITSALLVTTAVHAQQAAEPVVASSPSPLASLRDIIITAFAGVATVAIPIVIMWAKLHFRLMREAALNSALTQAASRAAAFAIMELRAMGTPVDASLGISNPLVQKYADRMLKDYPEFTTNLNMTEEMAAQVVLGEIRKQAQPVPVDVPVVTPIAPEPTLTGGENVRPLPTTRTFHDLP